MSASPQRFRPACPERLTAPAPLWRIFLGEYATNGIAGWPEAAFRLPYMYRRVFSIRYHVINDPDAARRILLDSVENYPKPALVVRLLSAVSRDNLFVADGEEWREQRHLMAPVFTPAAVAEFTPIFAEVARRVAESWTTPARIDVAHEATRTTFEVISRALFSGEPSLTSEEASDHITALLAATAKYRLGALIGMPWLDRSDLVRRGQAGGRYLHRELAAFIRRRQANPAPPQDFITRLMDAFAEHHPPERAAQLTLGNAILFFIAGHETTANAVSWSLYLMGGDPGVQARAAEEARDALAAGLPPTETVARLPYLRMVLEEAMRLYPPAPRIDRSPAAADELCGRTVRKGDLVTIWPWLLHRNRRLWEEPDLFDPENFSPEAKAKHHRFQYLPFGAGPRTCIGGTFAMTEGALILAEWLARCRFRLDPDFQVMPTAAVTLRPKGGLSMYVEPREAALGVRPRPAPARRRAPDRPRPPAPRSSAASPG